MTIGAIVLAAGRARRMGSDKLLADLGGRPLIRHIIDALAQAGLPPPLVAVPAGARNLVEAIGADAQPVEVIDHDDGMAHSLAAAVKAIPEAWQAAMICLGDMPFLSPGLLASLAAQAGAARIVVPLANGIRGNPVVWGRSYFAALAALRGDQGGRTLLDRFREHIVMFECGDVGMTIDVDTPEALAAARERFADT